MIKSLSISGFQSHEDTHLEFDKNVNVIVGQSDSGKTAILRALLWVVQNKPSGDTFRSSWADETVVKLEVDDHIITRTRSKSVNSYTLDGLEFKAMGTEVPQEIADVLNIGTVNINRQLDSPFLLSMSAGEVASHFNKVANLDKIDTSTQKINSAIRELNSDIKYSEGQESTLKEELDKFEHLDKFEADVEVLEEMDKEFIKVVNSKNKLEEFISNMQDINAYIKDFEPLLELEKPLEEIFKWKDEIESLEIETDELQFLSRQIKKTQSEIEEQNILLSIETPVNALLKLYGELEMVNEAKIKLSKALSNISSVSDRVERAKSLQSSLQASFEKAMPVGSECLLCGQIIKK